MIYVIPKWVTWQLRPIHKLASKRVSPNSSVRDVHQCYVLWIEMQHWQTSIVVRHCLGCHDAPKTELKFLNFGASVCATPLWHTRVVDEWNGLSSEVVDALTVESFKTKLDDFFNIMGRVYVLDSGNLVGPRARCCLTYCIDVRRFERLTFIHDTQTCHASTHAAWSKLVNQALMGKLNFAVRRLGWRRRVRRMGRRHDRFHGCRRTIQSVVHRAEFWPLRQRWWWRRPRCHKRPSVQRGPPDVSDWIPPVLLPATLLRWILRPFQSARDKSVVGYRNHSMKTY